MPTIFDVLIKEFTLGLVKDCETAVLGLLAISFLVFGIQLLIERFLGHSIETELEYRKYANERKKSEMFEKRFSKESFK